MLDMDNCLMQSPVQTVPLQAPMLLQRAKCTAAGPFKVTVAAHSIVQLMMTNIQEAQASASSAVVQSMSNAVVEMASLFVAVPESRLKQQIMQVNTPTLQSHLQRLQKWLLYFMLCQKSPTGK